VLLSDHLLRSSQQMPKDVKEAFTRVIMEENGLSEGEAAAYIRELVKNGRYRTEVWS
jgi:sulfite reductase alpha subunit-like flavoprotein